MPSADLLALLLSDERLPDELVRLFLRTEDAADAVSVVAGELAEELEALVAAAAEARNCVRGGRPALDTLLAPVLSAQRIGELLRSARLDSLFLDIEIDRLLALLGADWEQVGPTD